MSFSGLLNQQITISNRTGYDEMGNEVVGASRTIRCRFQRTAKRKLVDMGNVMTIDAIVYIESGTTIETDDKVVFGSDTYKVLGRYDAIDGVGNTQHIKLELIKWR